MYTRLVIDTLVRCQQRFIITYMDELMFDLNWNQTSAVLDLQQSVRPHMTLFEDKPFWITVAKMDLRYPRPCNPWKRHTNRQLR